MTGEADFSPHDADWYAPIQPIDGEVAAETSDTDEQPAVEPDESVTSVADLLPPGSMGSITIKRGDFIRG